MSDPFFGEKGNSLALIKELIYLAKLKQKSGSLTC